MHKDHPKKDFLFGAMLGSTLGALTAMIFTTKKGREIKKHLLDQYHELEGMIKGYAKTNERKAKRAVTRIAKNIKSKIKQAKNKIKNRN